MDHLVHDGSAQRRSVCELKGHAGDCASARQSCARRPAPLPTMRSHVNPANDRWNVFNNVRRRGQYESQSGRRDEIAPQHERLAEWTMPFIVVVIDRTAMAPRCCCTMCRADLRGVDVRLDRVIRAEKNRKKNERNKLTNRQARPVRRPNVRASPHITVQYSSRLLHLRFFSSQINVLIIGGRHFGTRSYRIPLRRNPSFHGNT